MTRLTVAIEMYRYGRGTFDDIEAAMANLRAAFDQFTTAPPDDGAPPGPVPELPLSTAVSGHLSPDSEAAPD